MILIRQMQEKDTKAAAKLEQEIFSQPWSENGFLDALKTNKALFLVAENQQEIVGYIGMYYCFDEGEITNVAVAEQQRCHGIGMLLLSEMLKKAQKKGVSKIVLEVRISNYSAIRLYERCGFKNCGVRKGFYDFPKEDAFIMICEI